MLHVHVLHPIPSLAVWHSQQEIILQ